MTQSTNQENHDINLQITDKDTKTNPVLRCAARNSDLTVTKSKRSLLTYQADGLASCVLEEAEDGIELLFEITGLERAEIINKKSKDEKYRFLVNAADLDKLSVEYEFSISPNNLLIDINLKPQVMMRDARHKNSTEFIVQYKALIGSVLQPKYKYEDYLNGGNDLYEKQKLLSTIVAHETVLEVKLYLMRMHENILYNIQKTKQLVSKKYVIISTVIIPTLLILLIASGIFLWQAFFLDIPFKNDIIRANSAYIANEYIETQRALSGYDISDLSFESRYFLARAYIITEALTDVQKENILQGITLRSDPVIFTYWILLGRLQFTEVIDIAQRLGDDELLLFAYLKYEVVVRNDTTISGDEKTTLLNNISERINTLQRNREEAIEAIDEE
ncbi:MAG: hypothetical protein LBD23_07915 [Oscillospiraceae bacterium]|nr:hypothetical protein [Oscillospiraceae bacterium]